MAGMIAHILGALFTCGAIALAAFGFATSNWLTVMVDRDNFEADISAVQNPTVKQALINVSATDPAFTSRVRGLYVTCYQLPDDDSITWPNGTTFKEGSCVAEGGYELNRQPSTVGYGPAYDMRIQKMSVVGRVTCAELMRCHYAFLVIGLFMIVLGGLGSAVGCCCIQVRLLQLAGCFNFGGAFFSAAGIAFFHGFIYLEMTQIDIQGFFFYYLSRPALYRTLTNNWTIGLGYSYILVWLAVGVAIVGGILYFIAASHIHTKRHEEEKKKLANERELTGARNPAYAAAEKAVEEEKAESDSDEEPDWENEIVEKEVVPVPEPVPVPYPVPVPVPSYPYPPDMYNQAPPSLMYDPPMYGGGGYDGSVIPAIIPASSYPYYDYGMYNSQL